jgi:tetratricopeptide (TPR) repeat protein
MKGDWQNATQLNTFEAYEEFLLRHPQGEFTKLAIQNIENLEWGKAEMLNTIFAYQEFLKRHRQGEFANEAKTRIEELEWEVIKENESIETYEEFLRKYPNSKFRQQASKNLEELEWEVTKKSESINAYEEFLRKYRWGKFALQALSNLSLLKEILNADTVDKIEILIKKYSGQYDVARKLVWKVESLHLKEIIDKGPEKRFVLKGDHPTYQGRMEMVENAMFIYGIINPIFNPDEVVYMHSRVREPEWCVFRFIGNIHGSSLPYSTMRPEKNDVNCIFLGKGGFPNQLTFCYLKGHGYIYLRGVGKVILPTGKEIRF